MRRAATTGSPLGWVHYTAKSAVPFRFVAPPQAAFGPRAAGRRPEPALIGEDSRARYWRGLLVG
jgi:hypothetical protein